MRDRALAIGAVAIAAIVTACSAPVQRDAASAGISSPTPEPSEAAVPVDYRFVDASAASGIDLAPRHSWGSAWIDHDDDGDPDLLVNRHYLTPVMLEHADTGYRRASWQETLAVREFDRHACLWGDPNADGLPDLLCSQGAERGKGSGPNQLLVQSSGGGFKDMAAELGLDYPQGRSRTINWVDYDGDADLDLFVGTQVRSGYPNEMFRNDDGRFRRVPVGLSHELETEVSSWADWDNDGDPDLLLTLKKGNARAYENRRGRFVKVRIPRVTDRDWLGASFGEFNRDRRPDLHLVNEHRSIVLANRGGSFRVVHRMRTRQGRMSVWFDADNDSDQDLFVVQGAPGKGDDPDAVDAPDILLIRKGTSFTKRVIDQSGARSGNGDSAAVADHDRNGTLDLFVTNGYKRSAGPFVLLENRTVGGGWAGLDLAGPPGNPVAMWVDLKVVVGSRVFWRRVTDGLSFRSQSEVGYVHLGLGSATSAAVTVVWPWGGRDCVTLQAGTVTALAQGSSPCS